MSSEIDWGSGLPGELLAKVAGGRDDLRVMRLVCKNWRICYGESVTQLKLPAGSPFLHPRHFQQEFVNLSSLDLSEYQHLADLDLEILRGSKISVLNLEESRDLTGEGLALLRGSRVTSLNLRECTKLTDACMAKLRGIPLEDLDLCMPPASVTPAALGALHGMTTLRKLALTQWIGLKPGDLAFLRDLPQLTSLDISCSVHVSDEALRDLMGLSLQELKIICLDSLTAEAICEVLEGMPLTSLGLGSYSRPFPNNLIQLLREMPLASLRLECDANAEQLALLARMPLTELHLLLPLDTTDAWLAPLRGMPLGLLHLQCHFEEPGKFSLRAFEGMPITDLTLDNLTQLTDTDLEVLKGMPLEILQLERLSGVTGAGLKVLSGAPLKRLYLSNWDGLDDRGLRSLGRLKLGLEALHIDGCNNITGDGLGSLQGMPIRAMSLWSCTSIEERFLGRLEGLPLKTLHSANCPRVSRAGAKNNLAKLVSEGLTFILDED